MSYQYGMKGAPAIGGGLPGLPSRRVIIGSKKPIVLHSIVSRTGSGVISPPPGVVMMRLAVVGAGGRGYGLYNSTVYNGGGGGGVAATKLFAAQDVVYSCAAQNSGTTPLRSTAAAGPYELIGEGGGYSTSTTTAAQGGASLGGDYNYTGKPGARSDRSNDNKRAAGGGAANIPAWLIYCPDLGAARPIAPNTQACGGPGVGAQDGGMIAESASSPFVERLSPLPYGSPPEDLAGNLRPDGGQGGGGGGVYAIPGSATITTGYGGAGMVFVQYFAEEE